MCVSDRWNSWNFFACNINETVIKETGKKKLLSHVSYDYSFIVCSLLLLVTDFF